MILIRPEFIIIQALEAQVPVNHKTFFGITPQTHQIIGKKSNYVIRLFET